MPHSNSKPQLNRQLSESDPTINKRAKKNRIIFIKGGINA